MKKIAIWVGVYLTIAGLVFLLGVAVGKGSAPKAKTEMVLFPDYKTFQLLNDYIAMKGKPGTYPVVRNEGKDTINADTWISQIAIMDDTSYHQLPVLTNQGIYWRNVRAIFTYQGFALFARLETEEDTILIPDVIRYINVPSPQRGLFVLGVGPVFDCSKMLSGENNVPEVQPAIMIGIGSGKIYLDSRLRAKINFNDGLRITPILDAGIYWRLF